MVVDTYCWLPGTLAGDLDCLPILEWVMSLKFLDGLERQRGGEAKLAGKEFKSTRKQV